jgi:DNA-binding response OmpR family regulator
VSVRDNGPGIPPEFQQNLFTRFAQADSSNSRSKGGTGLGLAIVKEILDRTGGAISYETSPAGTSFHVDLPAQPERRKRGVLLVQLDEQFAEEIRRALRERDIAVEAARDAGEIAAIAERRPYDAVVLGLAREGPSAAELVQSVRAHPTLAATPILAAAPGEPGQFSPAVELVDWLSEPPTPVTFERGRHLLRSTNGGSEDLHVLHVEDDEDVLGVVATAFEGKAMVAAARSADEARQALAAKTPDLVILDLALPGESGLALLPSLRRPTGEPIPVVIYTAHDEDPEIASRAVAMLTKSKASLDDLVATVLRIVQHREAVAS